MRLIDKMATAIRKDSSFSYLLEDAGEHIGDRIARVLALAALRAMLIEPDDDVGHIWNDCIRAAIAEAERKEG